MIYKNSMGRLHSCTFMQDILRFFKCSDRFQCETTLENGYFSTFMSLKAKNLLTPYHWFSAHASMLKPINFFCLPFRSIKPRPDITIYGKKAETATCGRVWLEFFISLLSVGPVTLIRYSTWVLNSLPEKPASWVHGWTSYKGSDQPYFGH